ncbi:WD repeat-containing 24 [Gossypium arboreum]|uniref:WD repeat-containing 24 n=1 Tax=Gossypium arboreum TaxID=29729 RepID=A0A0B0NQQ5_GOSAR|nr:WD repeat-containing 24 [Gossypium arboreum]
MSGFSQSSVSSQNSQRTKRKWVPEEDATLVACMVNLHNVGTFNADTGFKAGNLNELEKNSHKEAAQFRYRSFPYYDQLTAIYVKDRTTGKDAQTAADIIEEIDVEDIADTNTHEERNDFHGCEADVSLDDMDLSATQPQPARNQEGLTENEHYRALSKILDHPTQMLIFFSTSADH